MEALTMEAFTEWMDRYGVASEASDPEVAASLFAPDAIYLETPFDAPITGREAIYQYWSEAAGALRDVRFSYEILSVQGMRGITLWRADMTGIRTGKTVTLDGVFLVDFNAEGLCGSFREWWHRKEHDPVTQGD